MRCLLELRFHFRSYKPLHLGLVFTRAGPGVVLLWLSVCILNKLFLKLFYYKFILVLFKNNK